MKAMKATRFQLIIKATNVSREGKFTVHVKRMDTVGKVKAKIWKLCGTHPKDQLLTFRGVGMVDNMMMLEEYGIWRKVMVVLVLTENGINDMDMWKSMSYSSSSSSSSSSLERELFG